MSDLQLPKGQREPGQESPSSSLSFKPLRIEKSTKPGKKNKSSLTREDMVTNLLVLIDLFERVLATNQFDFSKLETHESDLLKDIHSLIGPFMNCDADFDRETGIYVALMRLQAFLEAEYERIMPRYKRVSVPESAWEEFGVRAKNILTSLGLPSDDKLIGALKDKKIREISGKVERSYHAMGEYLTFANDRLPLHAIKRTMLRENLSLNFRRLARPPFGGQGHATITKAHRLAWLAKYVLGISPAQLRDVWEQVESDFDHV